MERKKRKTDRGLGLKEKGGVEGVEGCGGGCSGADAAFGDLWKEWRNLAEPQPFRHGRVRDTGTQEEDRRR